MPPSQLNRQRPRRMAGCVSHPAVQTVRRQIQRGPLLQQHIGCEWRVGLQYQTHAQEQTAKPARGAKSHGLLLQVVVQITRMCNDGRSRQRTQTSGAASMVHMGVGDDHAEGQDRNTDDGVVLHSGESMRCIGLAVLTQTKARAKPRPLRIAVLAYAGCMGTQVFGISEVLRLAADIGHTAGGSTALPFDIQVIGLHGRRVSIAGGNAIATQRPVGALDLLIVPGLEAALPRGGRGGKRCDAGRRRCDHHGRGQFRV